MRSLQEYTTQKFDEQINEGLLNWLKKLFKFTWKSIKKINAYVKDNKFPVKGRLQEFHVAKIITSNNIYDFYKNYFKKINGIKEHLPATHEILNKINKYIDEDIIDLSNKKISFAEIMYNPYVDKNDKDAGQYFCGLICYINDIKLKNNKYKSLIIAYEIDKKVISNYDDIRDDLFDKILKDYGNKIGNPDKQEILFLYKNNLLDDYDYTYPSADLYYTNIINNLWEVSTEKSTKKRSNIDKSTSKKLNKRKKRK